MSIPLSPEMYLSHLGQTIRQARKQKAWTLKYLGAKAALSPRFLAQLEKGEGNISVLRLLKLIDALDLMLPLPFSASQGVVEKIMYHLHAQPLPYLEKLLSALEAEKQATWPLITLMGMRGAGKSAVGPYLGEELGVPFLELDERIQEQSGLSVGEIFAFHGEVYYRQAEEKALAAVVEEAKPCVVAVSGGIVTQSSALRLLHQHTLSIWLKTSPENHMTRVQQQGDSRPMVNRPNALREVHTLWEDRKKWYQQATLALDTTSLLPSACAAKLKPLIQAWLQQNLPQAPRPVLK